jgi:3,4-dehydroadipyl-CoA semialdehyde dehydrogenase
MGAEALESYLGGSWSRGHGAEIELVDPTNGSVLATASAPSVDLKAAVAFAREHGGPALRALSYAERAKLLGPVADVLAANRATGALVDPVAMVFTLDSNYNLCRPSR